MKPLQRVGVLAHPFRTSTAPIAEQVASSLRARGLETWVRTAWDAANARPLVENSDMVVAIGGDGAMLRTARVCSVFGVPIFGINAGHLGFLAEATVKEWPLALERILNGEYWIENRMMLHCEVWSGEQLTSQGEALNDVVISRGAIARPVQLETYINDTWTTTYNADGLIVATPTGSTAYALAVGGPILPPQLHNILVVPVAPHLSMERSLVLAEDSLIKAVVAPHTYEAEVVVTVDGELIGSMKVEDTILIRASQQVSSFIRLREQGYFFRSILDRLEPRLVMQRRQE